jgi:hypothetical protein
MNKSAFFLLELNQLHLICMQAKIPREGWKKGEDRAYARWKQNKMA